MRQGQVLRVKALTIEKITVERDGEHTTVSVRRVARMTVMAL